jgi:hypothetical protein
MASQLTLYNNALLILGERALQSLSEARESRRLLDTVWSRPAIDRCLQQGQWQFAMRSVEITRSPSITPSFGYQYGFDRPSDLIRSCAVCQDGHFNVPLLQYMVEGSYWYADLDPIYVRYVSNDVQFGGDLSLWPANFAAYVEAYLAEAIVTRLTQDENEWKRVRAVLSRALTEAKSTDAMEQATKFAPQGSWVQSRRGNRGGDRGNTGSLIG